MKKIDETGLLLCRIQADIFTKSITETNCSSAVFLRRFMNSDIAARMDKGGYIFEAGSPENAISEIENEFGKSTYGSVKYTENELYWIGYLYRYWCYTYEKTSKQVYTIIKPPELRSLFFPYHSLDTAAAIERITEAKQCDEENYITKGTEILKRLLEEKKNRRSDS